METIDYIEPAFEDLIKEKFPEYFDDSDEKNPQSPINKLGRKSFEEFFGLKTK